MSPSKCAVRVRRALASLCAITCAALAVFGTAAAASSAHPQGKTAVSTGVNVQFYDWNYSSNTIQKDAKKVFSYVKSLNANSVAITIPFEVPSLTANTMGAGAFTPSAAIVGTVVKIAVADKLKVMLRPMVDETNLRPGWRGQINPSSPNTWFANYGKFLKPYLLIAQTDKATAFDIATELQDTYKFSGWAFFVSAAKSYFHGTMVLSGSWSQPGTVAVPGASVGIDAYYPVSASPTAKVAALLAGWNANFARAPFPTAASKVTITEVAIPAQNGAYAQPNSYNIKSEKINAAIQANWFTAACQFVQQHKLAGLYFWRLDIQFSPTTAPKASSPLWFAPSTVKEIKACFKALK